MTETSVVACPRCLGRGRVMTILFQGSNVAQCGLCEGRKVVTRIVSYEPVASDYDYEPTPVEQQGL